MLPFQQLTLFSLLQAVVSDNTQSDLEKITKVAAVALAAFSLYLSAFQWSTMRKRNKVKADLEILKLIRDVIPESKHEKNILHKVNRRADRLRLNRHRLGYNSPGNSSIDAIL